MRLTTFFWFYLPCVIFLSTLTGQYCIGHALANAHQDQVENPTNDKPFQDKFAAGESLMYESPDSAISIIESAIKEAQSTQNDIGIAQCKNLLSYIFYIKGDYDTALSYALAALQLSDSLGYQLGKANSYNYIGLINSTQGKNELALEHHKKALEIGRNIKNQNRTLSSYFNIGLTYNFLQNYDSALYYINQALINGKEAGVPRVVRMSYNRKGEIYFDLGQLDSAHYYYSMGLDNSDFPSTWETVFALGGLQKVELQRGNIEKAIAYGEQGLQKAKSIDAKWEVLRILESLSEAYATSNQMSKAYELSRLLKNYSDSVFNAEKEKEINALLLKQNEQEKNQLKEQNLLQQEIINQRNLWMIIISMVSVLLLISVVLLYRNSKIKNSLNKGLIAQGERIKERNETIQQQNESLNRLNKSYSRLISIIGHDLRSPIFNTRAILEMVTQGKLNENEKSQIFKKLYSTVSYLGESLENLLAWNITDKENPTNEPEPIDIQKAVRKQTTYWQLVAEQKGIKIQEELEAGLIGTMKKNHFQTILRNLLSNAIKFSHEHTAIIVSAKCVEGKIWVSVKDSGIGMDDSITKSLLQDEGPIKSAYGTQNESGTGIGLKVCRELIEDNQQTWTIRSKPGEGTEISFSVSLMQ